MKRSELKQIIREVIEESRKKVDSSYWDEEFNFGLFDACKGWVKTTDWNNLTWSEEYIKQVISDSDKGLLIFLWDNSAKHYYVNGYCEEPDGSGDFEYDVDEEENYDGCVCLDIEEDDDCQILKWSINTEHTSYPITYDKEFDYEEFCNVAIPQFIDQYNRYWLCN